CEPDPPGMGGVEQRPDTGAVAREQQAPQAGIPQRDRKLAVEVFDETVAVPFVEVDDHLGVRSGVEAGAVGLQLRAQLHVIEDLPVEHGPYSALRVVDRLVAGRQVDDRQACVRQADAAAGVEAEAVRAAMGERGNHSLQQRAHRIRAHVGAGDPGYSTHAGRTPLAWPGALPRMAMSQACSVSRATCCQSRQKRPARRPWSQGRSRTSDSAVASAAESPGATSTPQSASITSGIPPTRVATTGRPQASASTSTLGWPSEWLGSVTRSAAAIHSATPVAGWLPAS